MWPSKVGVSKPWYFPVTHAYWVPPSYPAAGGTATANFGTNPINSTEVKLAEENPVVSETVPSEPVDESLLGRPTVQLTNLKKTFGEQVAVDNLSFDMYENQIFALLGHNGAGKVSKTEVNIFIYFHFLNPSLCFSFYELLALYLLNHSVSHASSPFNLASLAFSFL